MSVFLPSSSRAVLEQVARRVGSAKGAAGVAGGAVAEGASWREGGARRASTSARCSTVALKGQLRANGGRFARLRPESCSSSSSSSSSRSETTLQTHVSLPMRPPRIHLPASAPGSPLSRLFSSSSYSYASSTSSATSDQLDPEPNAEEPPEQQIRRAWSQSLASRRAQWSQPSGKGGSGGGGGGGSRSALPKEVFDLSFSRSHGPGGQNVNKVNTKANVRLLLAAASSPSIFDSGKSPLPVPIPREVVSRLVEKSVSETYYTQASHSLLVSSESLRTQEGNLSDAIEKVSEGIRPRGSRFRPRAEEAPPSRLYTLLLGLSQLLDHLHQHATADLINPTPLHQKEKVQRLIAREKGKLKKVKSQRSAVKSGRRDKGF